MAKHLATSGCSTAYPDAETASKALRGASGGGGGPAPLAPTAEPAGDGDRDEITSYDPSEEMAKAYMKDKGGAERPEPEGPLAFLGLQQKKEEEGREVKDATKEAKKDDCEASKKDGDPNPKDAEDSSMQEGAASGGHVGEENRGDEEATASVEDQQLADIAPAETAVTESEETSRSETEVGAMVMDTSDTATKEPAEQGYGPAAATEPTEPLPRADTADEVEAPSASSRELSTPVAENSAPGAPQAGEAGTPAAAAEDTSASLAPEAMETE